MRYKLQIKKPILSGKKRFWIVVIFIAFMFMFLPMPMQNETFADTGLTYEEIQSQLENNIKDQLGDLNFSEIEEIIKNLNNPQNQIFGAASFLEKLKLILSGDFAQNANSLWEALLSVLFNSLLKYLPIISAVVAISIFGGMLQGLKPNTNGKSISNIIHFVSYGMVVVTLLTIVAQLVQMTSGVITSIKAQMDAIFPVLLTLLTALGGTVSVSIYQPAMGLLTGVILNLFNYVLLPIFIFSIVFSVISNLSNNVKLDKFTSFFNSTYKWLVGLIFTIFTAFISIQGITAGSIDGISIRTAKYAIKSYIPLVGGYLSDGIGLILASSSLIKNAVGAGGLILLLASVLSPLIEIVLFMLALKLIAGIVQPLGNSQIANFLSMLAKSMTMLISLIIAVSFIYFIMLGLIMCTAGIV